MVAMVLCTVVVGAVVGYFFIFPPLTLSIVEVTYNEPVILGKPAGFRVLKVFVTYTNNGLIDLTISGESNIRVDGQSGYRRRYAQFLLRRSESATFDVSPSIGRDYGWIPDNPNRFKVEVISFLIVNGGQRTLAATYEFHR